MAKRLMCIVLSVLMIMAVLPTGVVAEEEVTYTNWSSDSIPTTSGKYKLSKDITVSSTYTIAYESDGQNRKDVTIDLNGHTITFDTYGTNIYLNGGNLTILDSSEGGTGKIIHTGGQRYSEAIIYVQGGTFTLESGTICTGNGVTMQNGIYSTGGEIIINGGTISGDYKNASVCVNQGKATFNGGTISNSYDNNHYTIQSGTSLENSPVTIAITDGTFGDTINLDSIATYGSCTVTGGTFTATGYAVVEEYIDAGNYTCTVNGNGTYTVSKVASLDTTWVSAYNVKNGSSLSMGFYIPMSKMSDPSDYTVKITITYGGTCGSAVEGQSYSVTYTFESEYWTTADAYSEYFIEFNNIMAYQMTDQISVDIYCDGVQVCETFTTCIRDYELKYLDVYDSDETKKELAYTILYYGGASQREYGYNTNDCADSTLPSLTSLLSLIGE